MIGKIRGKLLVGAVAVVIALGLLGLAAGCGAPAPTEKIELVYASYLDPLMAISKNSVNYLKELEKISDGLVTVKQYAYMSSMFGASDLIPACGKGLADVVVSAPLYTPALTPYAAVTEMPYCTEMLGADAWAKAKLYEEFEPYRKQYEDNNVKILIFIPSSPSSAGVRGVVNSLVECKGLTMRAYGTIGECLKAAGITPVALSVSDVYTGMERGTIEGWAGLPLGGLEGTGLLDVTKTLIDPGFGMYGSCSLAMNMDVYKKLPAKVKDWIEDMRKGYVLEMAKFSTESEFATMKIVKEKGIKVVASTPEQKLAFKQLVNPETTIHAKYIKELEGKGLQGQKCFDTFMKYVKEWEPKSPYKSPY
jgi:TRAP-type C4-dicarboxylate transport system substrate-binding protein